ncbi:putative RNA-binding Zn ribbon-like protein [Tamaricihabitans halophyticus]|uniref:Putative RNA-binding Zn ribbon-like protein n=1 Tax=Tamaricihabitans halophyticus TaxID=1262583 RepID=A0A4R2R6H5_9PSEU|nr:CGNR zinc finger domain-containing protein [Tamaricihabitans halophyticus]TCP57448.1 putative RNA-binding Zn ribbon-like protein [Tamaricihabitans halophyticus]
MPFDRPAAPGALAELAEFLNSAWFLRAEDAFERLPDARAWLSEHGYARAARTLTNAKRMSIVDARELMRGYLRGQRAARDKLTGLAAELLGSPRWTEDGPDIPVARGSAVRELIGAQLRILTIAGILGQAERLKVCRAPDCRFVFYDRSPSNTGTWCSMEICGARHKMRAYRARRRQT